MKSLIQPHDLKLIVESINQKIAQAEPGLAAIAEALCLLAVVQFNNHNIVEEKPE